MVEKKKPKKEEKPKKALTRKKAEKAEKPAGPPKPAPEPAGLEEKTKPEKYYEATGRRKTSVARVRLWTRGDKVFSVNGKTLDQYFPSAELRILALSPLETMNCLDKFRTSSSVKGGGLSSQAQALRHGISKALVLFNPDFKKRLKKAGFLIRDPRMRERKKFGLKRARRAPQWQKR